jgi:preprotein translocase subunit YajC
VSSNGSSQFQLLFLVGLAALMYFFLIRPQSRRRKEAVAMQQSLAIGSDVITVGGLYGTVVALDEETVTLEVCPGVTNRFSRPAIGKVVPPAQEPDGAGDDSTDGPVSAE